MCHFAWNLNYFSVNILWINTGTGDETFLLVSGVIWSCKTLRRKSYSLAVHLSSKEFVEILNIAFYNKESPHILYETKV